MTVKIRITTERDRSRSRFVDRVRAVVGRGGAARPEVPLVEPPAPDREDVTARRADPLALDPYSPIG